MKDNEFYGIITPVGRLVMGSLFKGQTTDSQGNPLLVKNGPNAGDPRTDYFCALAISKKDPGWPAFHEKLKAAAQVYFPHLHAADGTFRGPNFSWKLIDGDSDVPNQNGKIPNTREGFPGCYILSMSSGFPSALRSQDGSQVITDENAAKPGYYYRAIVSIRGNGSTQRPGLFINHNAFQFVAYGPEIVFGPDHASALQAAPAPYLPPGASAEPVAPAVPPEPAPAMAPAAPPAMAPAPDPNFGRMYEVGGTLYTRDQLLAAGWTFSQIDSLPGDKIPF